MIEVSYGKRINPKYGYHKWYARAKTNMKGKEPSFSQTQETLSKAKKVAEDFYSSLKKNNWNVKYLGRKDLDCSRGNC